MCKVMSEDTKTYVFGDGANNNVLSTLVPLLQNKGVDPNLIAMMNNGGFGGNNGGWFMWIVFLAILGGWGGNGFGGGFGNNGGAGFLANQINNNEGRDLLMQAIQGNKDSIANLASTLGVDFSQVSSALNSINTQLCGIGKDIGMTGQQVINAIQQGNMNIAQQMCNSFGQISQTLCQQTSTLQSSICDAKTTLNQGLTMLGFQQERQTNELTKAISASTQTIVDGQKAAEIRELNAIIAKQNTDIAELKAAASTRSIVDSALAPVLIQLNQLAQAQAAGGGGGAAKVAGA